MRHLKKAAAAAMAGLIAFVMSGCGTITGDRINPEKPARTYAEKTVKVGFVYPKTGQLSSFGDYTDRITRYAIAQANMQGLTIDGENAVLKLVTEDSGSDPEQARKAALDLISNKKVDVMITSKTADTTLPVSSACEDKKKLCISVDTPDEAWAIGRHKYSFHAGFDSYSEYSVFCDAWDKISTNKKISIMHANDAEGSTLYSILPDLAEKKGYTVYDPGSYMPGSGNFKEIVQNMKKSGCDIVAGVMTPEDYSVFYRKMVRAGIHPKMISIAKAGIFKSDIEHMKDMGGNGLIHEVWWTPEFPTESSINDMNSEELGTQFTTLTGESVVPSSAGYDYANIEILYAILKWAGSLDTDKLITAAKNLDIQTIIGRVHFNKSHYSRQPVITGQWIYDTKDKTYHQHIIATSQVKGMKADSEVVPFIGQISEKKK